MSWPWTGLSWHGRDCTVNTETQLTTGDTEVPRRSYSTAGYSFMVGRNPVYISVLSFLPLAAECTRASPRGKEQSTAKVLRRAKCALLRMTSRKSILNRSLHETFRLFRSSSLFGASSLRASKHRTKRRTRMPTRNIAPAAKGGQERSEKGREERGAEGRERRAG